VNTKVMRALRFAEFGAPSVLRIEEVAIPEPREGEALVQVSAAAINPATSRTSRDASGRRLCHERPAGILRALL
jgi:NADPH:quinone reductase-like Zn-dependent oxidoreductase